MQAISAISMVLCFSIQYRWIAKYKQMTSEVGIYVFSTPGLFEQMDLKLVIFQSRRVFFQLWWAVELLSCSVSFRADLM